MASTLHIWLAILQLVPFDFAAAELTSVSLNGNWHFSLDEHNVGVSEKWFLPSIAKEKLTERIAVPGISVGAAGFGNATDIKNHEYTAVSWYARNVTLPDLSKFELSATSSASTVVAISGVMRSLRLWVNGNEAGSHSGYMDPFEIDITAHVRNPPKSLTLVAAVDGNCQSGECCQSGCFDAQVGSWSGLWGDVSLVLRDDTFALEALAVDMVSLASDGSTALVEVSAALRNHLFDGAGASLEVSVAAAESPAQAIVKQVVPLAPLLKVVTEGRLRLNVSIRNPKLWSFSSPSLYWADLQVRRNVPTVGDVVIDRHRVRFGLRNLEINGSYFMLNGMRHFLHGCGDDFGYVTEAPPMNKSVYLQRLQTMKDFGFNYIRLHSHFEVPLYFEVADELGIFVSPALPLAESSNCHDLQLRTWRAQISLLRNHPSFMDINMGNEYYGDSLRPRVFPWRSEFYQVAKSMFPKLPVIDTDGCCYTHNDLNQVDVQNHIDGSVVCPLGSNMSCLRDTSDFMTQFFGYTTPLIYPDMYNLHAGGVSCTDEQCLPPKPLISHEMGNFGAFPDLPAEIAALRPTNFRVDMRETQLADLHKLGLAPHLDKLVRASRSHAYASWKRQVEFLRLSPGVTGHQWWLFQDWLGAGNGVVDFTLQPKGGALAAHRVRQFVNPVVILVENGTLWNSKTRSTVYGNNETIRTNLLVSNFAPTVLVNCNLSWIVTSGSTSIAKGVLHVPMLPQGAIRGSQDWLGEQVAFSVDVGSVPKRVNLSTTLVCTGLTAPVTNDWSAWVYPDHSAKKLGNVPVYGLPSIYGRLHEFLPEARPAPTEDVWPSSAIYVAGVSDLQHAGLSDAVSAGATLLVLESKQLGGLYNITCKAPFAFRSDNNLCYSLADYAKAKTGPCGSWCEVIPGTGHGCPSNPHNCPWVPSGKSILPYKATPALFHSPTWVQTTGVPAALVVMDAAPEGLKALADEDGGVDHAFFPAFGPTAGRCNLGVRSGMVYNVTQGNVTLKGGVWMRALFMGNAHSPGVKGNSFMDSAAIFEYTLGKGRVVVSGLNLDLLECDGDAKPSPHDRFDRRLVTTLIEAVVPKGGAEATFVV